MHLKYPAISLIFGTILMTACGPTLEEGSDARIRVTPARQVTFSKVAVGSSHALPFVVTSVGRDELNVRKIEWEGSAAVSLSMTGSELPRPLASQTSMPVSVNFSPTDANPSPKGVIKIYSSDPETPVYELEVVAQQLSPLIHVVPSSEEKLIFGQTDKGTTTTRDIVITNVGDLPLNLSEIKLNASDDFSYSLVNSASVPVSLAANAADQLTVQVAFTPGSIGKQEGNIVFVSNDPTHPTYTLPIIANSDTPCLQIQPTLLEFSPALSVGTSQTKPVLLTSCSEVPLIISDVIKTGGSDTFKHELTGANTELKNGESATLNITFSPISEGNAQAEYVIMNNDPLQANAVFKVMGSSSANQCPNASAQGRLSSSSTWAKTLDLAPLDTVILDGSQSSDKESTELTYYWSIQSAPKDSTSSIAAEGSKASFFLDLAGNYELCLSVEDSAGMMSCNTDCVTVTATPRETIHVQLVWHTPKDKKIGDEDGTDLDLHFMTLPDGKWGDTGTAELNNGTDVYFNNREPVWTVPNQLPEYPSLDIDDKDGEGPENINLDQPSPCRWYAIGVHYYQDNAFGPSYATVRSYIDGKLRFEKANISLKQTGVFKQVAWLFWDGKQGVFYETDLAYDNDKAWIGLTPDVPKSVLDKAKVSSPHCFK
ncbi:MAG: choice-of-anchor D domain-containing protein [Proteobacteria bacterium]|nr:choice-of-anchor D domain-containing protein [Pseudomonadota bacterium]MBQ9818096.1 choice-of-anchor D domain-containing protein [Pseudomonadota bacterium]